MYKRILVPIDGSDTANLGMREAIRLAKNTGAKIRLLHVVDEAVRLHYAEAPTYSIQLLRRLEKQGTRILEKGKREASKQGVDVSTSMDKKLAPVADTIVEGAKKWSADVIVLGTHGRRGFGRLVMGSDAESIVRTAPVPVLLINSKTARSSRKRRPTRH
jgi:nucleotide-binding universal stress UspA family protein